MKYYWFVPSPYIFYSSKTILLASCQWKNCVSMTIFKKVALFWVSKSPVVHLILGLAITLSVLGLEQKFKNYQKALGQESDKQLWKIPGVCGGERERSLAWNSCSEVLGNTGKTCDSSVSEDGTRYSGSYFLFCWTCKLSCTDSVCLFLLVTILSLSSGVNWKEKNDNRSIPKPREQIN